MLELQLSSAIHARRMKALIFVVVFVTFYFVDFTSRIAFLLSSLMFTLLRTHLQTMFESFYTDRCPFFA
jgi:MFS superfamily sulfate permease-like transporter